MKIVLTKTVNGKKIDMNVYSQEQADELLQDPRYELTPGQEKLFGEADADPEADADDIEE